MTDLALAVGHHLAVFSLLGVLGAGLALTSAPLTRRTLRILGALDASYGALAGLVLTVGLLRVLVGLKGAEFYLSNPIFWLKIAAFLVVGLLSIPPTICILGWRKASRLWEDFVPSQAEVARVRRFQLLQIAVFPLIPAFAAVMAEGHGLG